MRRVWCVLVVTALLIGGTAGCGPETPHALPQDLLSRTLDLSRDYVSLRYRTDALLTTAESYPDLATWRAELDTILDEWADLEAGAGVMEDQADRVVAAATAPPGIPVAAAAVRTDTLQDVFDAAPAGRKLRTLAAHLGTDARTALRLLEQEAAKAAGDVESYTRMINTALVIKNSCKVVGFVGAVVATGGLAAATATTLGTTTLVVTGADLVLEVTDDAATIALGDGNKVSQIAQSARTITEPLGAVLTVANLPANLTRAADKLSAFTFGAEGMRAAAQDGRIVGIRLPAYRGGDARVTSVAPGDLERWLTAAGVRTPSSVVEALASLGLALPGGTAPPTPTADPTPSPEPTATAPEPEPEPEPPAVDDFAVVGQWIGYVVHNADRDFAVEGMTLRLEPGGGGQGFSDEGPGGQDLSWSVAGTELTVTFASGRTLAFALAGDTMDLTADTSGTAQSGALSHNDLP